MPQLQSINLLNSNANQIAYTPIGIDSKGVARLADTSAPSLETQGILSVAAKRPVAGGSQVFRLNVKLTKPTVAFDSNGVPRNTGDNFINVEIVLNKMASVMTARDLLAELTSYLAEPELKTMVESKIGYY